MKTDTWTRSANHTPSYTTPIGSLRHPSLGLLCGCLLFLALPGKAGAAPAYEISVTSSEPIDTSSQIDSGDEPAVYFSPAATEQLSDDSQLAVDEALAAPEQENHTREMDENVGTYPRNIVGEIIEILGILAVTSEPDQRRTILREYLYSISSDVQYTPKSTMMYLPWEAYGPFATELQLSGYSPLASPDPVMISEAGAGDEIFLPSSMCFEDLSLISRIAAPFVEVALPMLGFDDAPNESSQYTRSSAVRSALELIEWLVGESTCSRTSLQAILESVLWDIFYALGWEEPVIREGTKDVSRSVVDIDVAYMKDKVNKSSHQCTGSLLDSCHVLTAQHCLLTRKEIGEGKSLTVGVTANERSSVADGGQRYDVGRAVPHPKVDLAILTLKNRVDPAPASRELDFSDLSSKKKPYSSLGVTGFGQTASGSDHRRLSGAMSFLGYESRNSRPFVDDRETMTTYPFINMEPLRRRWQSTCFGDSGGPVIYDQKLVGVITGSAADLKMSTVCVNKDKKWKLTSDADRKEAAYELLTVKKNDVNLLSYGASYPPQNYFQSLRNKTKEQAFATEELATLASSYHVAQETCRRAGEGYRLPTATELRTALVDGLVAYEKTQGRTFSPGDVGATLPSPRRCEEPLDLSDKNNPIWLPACESRVRNIAYWVETGRMRGDPRGTVKAYEIVDFASFSRDTYAQKYLETPHFQAVMVGPMRDSGESPGAAWATDDDGFFPMVKFHNILFTDCEQALALELAVPLYHDPALKDAFKKEEWIAENAKKAECNDLKPLEGSKTSIESGEISIQEEQLSTTENTLLPWTSIDLMPLSPTWTTLPAY